MTTKILEAMGQAGVDIDAAEVQREINRIFSNMLGYGEPKNSIFNSFFDKRFFDKDGFLDLGMPLGGPAAIAMLTDEDILDDHFEFRAWDEVAIRNFNDAFKSKVLPILKK